VFAGSTRLTPDNDFVRPPIYGLTFDATAGAFTLAGSGLTLFAAMVNPEIGGNNTLGFNNGGIWQQSPSAQTVNQTLTINFGRHEFVTVPGAGNVAINSAFTRREAATAHFAAQGGQFVTSVGSGLVNNLATGIVGAWATAGATTAEASWATRNASGAIVPYSGFSHTFSAAGGFPAGATIASNVKFTGGGAVAIPPDAMVNTLLMSSDAATADTLTVSNVLTFGNSGGIYRSGDAAARHVIAGGTITAGTSSSSAELHIRTRTSQAPNPGAAPPEALEIASRITNNASGGSVSVVKSGYGTLHLSPSSPSTFTGGLFVNEGHVRAATLGALGAAASPIYVSTDAQAFIDTSSTIANPWFVKGRGPQEAGGTAEEFRGGAIRVNVVGAELAGSITLIEHAGITARGAQTAAGPGAVISGKITGIFGLELNRFTNQGGVGLEDSMPTLTVSNSANDWNGGTSIGRGRVRIGGAGEVLPHGPGAGTLELVGEQAGSATVLDLNGNTETVNGLTSSGVEAAVSITNSLAGTTGALRFGAADASSTFGGAIRDSLGAVALTKIGAGDITLISALNNWSGDTRVEAGTLSVGASTWATTPSTADVYVNDGAIFDLNFAGTKLIDSLFFGAASQATGTWGSLASTATHKDARFTGLGLLNVTNGGGMTFMPADFDQDGDVDGADLAQWRGDFGLNGDSDADDDGDSDGFDFLAWQRQLGTSPPATAATKAVPEPTAFALTTAVFLAGAVLRRRG
jgi:autotransporter-associated beta strand protein